MILICSPDHSKIVNIQHKLHCKWTMTILFKFGMQNNYTIYYTITNIKIKTLAFSFNVLIFDT